MSYLHAYVGTGSIHVGGIITALGAVAGAIGVFFVWRSVKATEASLVEAEKSREAAVQSMQSQVAMEVARRWAGEDLVACRRLVRQYPTREDLAKAFDAFRAQNSRQAYILQRELDFFEDLAIAEQLHTISWAFIELSLGAVVWDRWQMWEPSINRLWGDDPTVYVHFRTLAERMREKLEL
jgi:hypothetical protein